MQKKPRCNPQTIERLAVPNQRPEFLDTPGPYSYSDMKDTGRFPMVFRTSERWPKLPPPPQDAINYDHSVVERKTRVVVFSTEERWRDKDSTTKFTRNYDVEKGLKAIEKRPFCATFTAGPKRKLLPVAALSDSVATSYNTIAGTSIPGGRISGGTRDTAESLILHSDSPGPIYNPSVDPVRPRQSCPVFSTQSRIPDRKQDEIPSALTYADSVTQEEHLSTRPRSPQVVFGSVPPSTSMPFPYTIHNICNSLSMRTRFCKQSKLEPARAGEETVSTPFRSSRPMSASPFSQQSHRPHSSSSSRRGKLRPATETPAVKQWVERSRAVSAALKQNDVSVEAPFCMRRPATPIVVQTVSLPLEDRTLEEMSPVRERPSRPSTAASLLRSAIEKQKLHRSEEISSESSPVNGEEGEAREGGGRFRYAPKYPFKYEDEGYHSKEFMDCVAEQLRRKKKVPKNCPIWESSKKVEVLIREAERGEG